MRFCAAISRCWCELSITISRYLSKAISIIAIGSRNDLEEITYKFFGWSERWRVEKLCRLINGEAKAIHEKWSAERAAANEEKRSEQRKENAGKNGSERGRVNHDKKRTPRRQKQKKREGSHVKMNKSGARLHSKPMIYAWCASHSLFFVLFLAFATIRTISGIEFSSYINHNYPMSVNKWEISLFLASIGVDKNKRNVVYRLHARNE